MDIWVITIHNNRLATIQFHAKSIKFYEPLLLVPYLSFEIEFLKRTSCYWWTMRWKKLWQWGFQVIERDNYWGETFLNGNEISLDGKEHKDALEKLRKFKIHQKKFFKISFKNFNLKLSRATSEHFQHQIKWNCKNSTFLS